MLTLLFVTLLQTASASTQDCTSLFLQELKLPQTLRKAFTLYHNPEYLAPLNDVWVHRREATPKWDLIEFHLGTNDSRAQQQLFIEGEFAVHHKKNLVRVVKTDMTPGLGAGYAYRVLLSHILMRYPQTRAIEFHHVYRPDYDLLRQQLAAGKKLRKALRTLPSYEAAFDFGFRLHRKQRFKLYNPEELKPNEYVHPAQIYFVLKLLREDTSS